MVNLLGFALTIETARGTLPEYPYPDLEPPNTKTVYIEVPPSADPLPFTVRVRPTLPLLLYPRFGFAAHLFVDGVKDAYFQPTVRIEYADSLLYDGIHVNTPDRTGAVRREMVFRELETMEGGSDGVQQADVDLGELGVIKVQFLLVINTEVRLFPAPLRPVQAGMQKGKICEKMMKGSGSSHSAGLGRELTGRVGVDKAHWTIAGDETKEVVRFLYRSRAALQSLGVVPFDLLTPRIKREQGKGVNLKREYEDVIDLTEVDSEVKREAGIKQERRVKRRFHVVDLT
ncbi:hypothetical protein BJ508DRAFT_379594 [Ascobolus immersus RN42]|uniref:DUF7918 domain-containing protein n=1 Tax=Ascobolus immersus RN42 TaxID=1160509 RepID=A0A3N4HQU6_ASCIM|nr:hypothetical protein BJ508DRAFT_379594 [Ascobolus immersus RN42]